MCRPPRSLHQGSWSSQVHLELSLTTHWNWQLLARFPNGFGWLPPQRKPVILGSSTLLISGTSGSPSSHFIYFGFLTCCRGCAFYIVTRSPACKITRDPDPACCGTQCQAPSGDRSWSLRRYDHWVCIIDAVDHCVNIPTVWALHSETGELVCLSPGQMVWGCELWSQICHQWVTLDKSCPCPEPPFLLMENESPRLGDLWGLVKPKQPVCLILCVNSDNLQRLPWLLCGRYWLAV